MKSGEFLSKASCYEGDYNCVLRSPGSEFSFGLHYHDFYEAVIYLGTAGTLRVKNDEYAVKRGDIALIDIFTPHTLCVNGQDYYERFSVSIDPGLLISFSTPQSNLLDIFSESGTHHRLFHAEEEAFEKYIILLNEYRRISTKNGRDILEKALVHHLLSYIYSDCFIEAKHSATDSNHLSIVTQLINHIGTHLDEELPLPQLAQLVNYSEYYVCRLFKKLTGKTLTSYIQEKRIEQAVRLIKEGHSIGAVAESVGFSNYSYFYKTFKRLKGCSPADFKERTRTAAAKASK